VKNIQNKACLAEVTFGKVFGQDTSMMSSGWGKTRNVFEVNLT